MSEIKPETQAEIILSSWLQSHGVQIWYNRKIKELNNQNIFKTQGESNKKPDMVIYSQFLKEYGAIEIKSGITNKDVYDASKIIKYQREYKERKTKYYIDEKEININFFIVATRHSINGHLFEKETKITPDDEKWHKTLSISARVVWRFVPGWRNMAFSPFLATWITAWPVLSFTVRIKRVFTPNPAIFFSSHRPSVPTLPA